MRGKNESWVLFSTVSVSYARLSPWGWTSRIHKQTPFRLPVLPLEWLHVLILSSSTSQRCEESVLHPSPTDLLHCPHGGLLHLFPWLHEGFRSNPSQTG